MIAKPELINIEIEDASEDQDVEYHVSYTGPRSPNTYSVIAMELKTNEFRLYENGKGIEQTKEDWKTITGRKAADNAIYQLATEEAERRLKELGVPEIKDLTQKTQ